MLFKETPTTPHGTIACSMNITCSLTFVDYVEAVPMYIYTAVELGSLLSLALHLHLPQLKYSGVLQKRWVR